MELKMQKMQKVKLLIATGILVVSILLASSVAWAKASADLVYIETPLTEGWYQYDYTAYNTSTAGEALWDIGFWYNPDAAFIATFTWLSIPTGWTLAAYSDTRVEEVWSTDVLNTPYTRLYTVPAGGSLSGFNFEIDRRLGDIEFDAYFLTSTNANVSSGGITHGTTVVPIVPEPISSILFLSGGAMLTVRTYLKKRKQSA